LVCFVSFTAELALYVFFGIQCNGIRIFIKFAEKLLPRTFTLVPETANSLSFRNIKIPEEHLPLILRKLIPFVFGTLKIPED
jgi:hypothetical protein